MEVTPSQQQDTPPEETPTTTENPHVPEANPTEPEISIEVENRTVSEDPIESENPIDPENPLDPEIPTESESNSEVQGKIEETINEQDQATPETEAAREADATNTTTEAEVAGDVAEVNPANDDSGDDYDPEAAFSYAETEQAEKSPEVSAPTAPETEPSVTAQDPAEQDDDEYDPASTILSPAIPPKPVHVNEEKKPSLPPKPPVLPQAEHTSLKEAYEAVMRSEVVNLPQFATLSQEEQMGVIQRLLQEKNIALPEEDQSAKYPGMNYDQVYSYNKPFKNLKDPIPLVPLNKYCRRPNITLPMSLAERKAYDKFLDLESRHDWHSKEGFPENLRLFVGNLPANTISKEDLFRIFSQYGEVVEISIKGGYGFVQFMTAEACAECIKGETNVPLHNKTMRLDASRSQRSSNGPQTSSRGRERSDEEERSPKRAKPDTPDCQVLITSDSTNDFVDVVENTLTQHGITFTVRNIGPTEPSEEVSEAAYLGVIGACVVKASKIDLQVFEETEDGGIKFDEYLDIEPSVMLDIFSAAKKKRVPEQPKRRDDHRRREPHRDSYHGNNYPERGERGDRRHRDRRGRQPNQGSNWGRGNQWDPEPLQWNQSQQYQQQPYNQGGYQQGYSQGQGYNQGPGYSQGQGYGSQNYGQHYQQSYGQPYQQPYPQQNIPPQNYQQGFNGGYNAPQAAPAAVPQADPALLQTLQNLDPVTMQNVVNLLQQKSAGLPTAPSFQSYGRAAQPPPPPPVASQPNQINSLLSLLQSHQQPYNGYQQPPTGPQQPQPPQQPQGQPNSALMDMLTRLGKQ